MARSTSPIFNEAPRADNSPAEMVTKTSPSSSSSADASVSAASASPTTSASSASVVAPAPPTPADCLQTPVGSPSSVADVPGASDTSKQQPYACVTPVVLQTFRKSCLKRSKSTVLPALAATTAKKMPLVETENAVPETQKRVVQKNRRRCWECKVKVGLTAVTCRCDYTFCNKHRYAEEHNCQFNFKTAGKRKLEAENPLVVPRKVARIN